MRYSICLPYYENPGMLHIQVDEWRKHKSCDLIIIDDCSKRNPASEVIGPEKGLSLYRVNTDIAWHQHGCRNLGATVAETPYLFLTDMDHLLRAEDAEKLSNENPPHNTFFMFSRVTAPAMTSYKPHPNSFLVSKEKYWEVGGYDEDFCDPSGPPGGMYGGDGIFTRQLSEICGSALRHDIALVRYPREHVPDASTTNLDRDSAKKAYRAEFDRKRAEDDLIPKNPIRFEWQRIL